MSHSTILRIRGDWGATRTHAPLFIATIASAALLMSAVDAFAQAGLPGGTGGMPRPGANRQPMGASAMPQPGGLRTPPGGSTGKKPAAKKTKDKQPVDNTTLPPGYVIPPEPPPEFTTTEEWTDNPFEGLTKQQKAQMLAKYRDLLTKGRFNNEKDEKKLVDDVIQGKLSEMTRKEARDDNKVVERRLEVTRELKLPKGIAREVRTYALQSIVRQAPKLFGYHILARINGAILLSELNETDEEGTSVAAVPYVPAFEPLLAVLNDEKQHDGVRALAVKGLVRIALDQNLRADTRHQIVESLVTNANRSGKYADWLQYRLADAFAEIKVLYSRDKKPYVAQALAQMLVDINRPWFVRARAAYAIGRLPYDREVDLTLLSYEIVKLAQQMASAYSKNPTLPEWRVCFFDLYLAFKPATDVEDRSKEGGLLKQVEFKGGALAPHKKSIQESYAQVLLLVEKVLKGAPGIQDAMTKVEAWLVANPPAKRSIGQGQPDLIIHELKSAPIDNSPKTAAPVSATPATGG